MATLEELKKVVEKVSGLGRPTSELVQASLKVTSPRKHHFKPSLLVPNHRWPLVHYRSAVKFPSRIDPAALFEELFRANGWGKDWRNGVYDYQHYHSAIHEVMGVARGEAVVLFGGSSGRKLTVTRGDVVVLPAGTGHICISHTDDFLVVGAYPATGRYDVCKPNEKNLAKAKKAIPRLPPPLKDPVYGKEGPLVRLWRRTVKKAKAKKVR